MSVIVVKVSLGYVVILFDRRKSSVMARDGEGSTVCSCSHYYITVSLQCFSSLLNEAASSSFTDQQQKLA